MPPDCDGRGTAKTEGRRKALLGKAAGAFLDCRHEEREAARSRCAFPSCLHRSMMKARGRRFVVRLFPSLW